MSQTNEDDNECKIKEEDECKIKEEDIEGRLPYLRHQISRQGARIYCDSTNRTSAMQHTE